MVNVLIWSNALQAFSWCEGLPAQTELMVIHQRISIIIKPALIKSNYAREGLGLFAGIAYRLSSLDLVFAALNHVVAEQTEGEVIV